MVPLKFVNTVLLMLALCVGIVWFSGCASSDARIKTALNAVEDGQKAQARNTDRIWAAFIASYREKETAIIDGYYNADVKKADSNKPNRANFTTLDAYAEDLVNYTSERATFLAKSDMIRRRNLAKLDDKIGQAQKTYDATKENREQYAKLVDLLKQYEDAKIDPSAVAPLFQQIVSIFIPIDTIPAPVAVQPKPKAD